MNFGCETRKALFDELTIIIVMMTVIIANEIKYTTTDREGDNFIHVPMNDDNWSRMTMMFLC